MVKTGTQRTNNTSEYLQFFQPDFKLSALGNTEAKLECDSVNMPARVTNHMNHPLKLIRRLLYTYMFAIWGPHCHESKK